MDVRQGKEMRGVSLDMFSCSNSVPASASGWSNWCTIFVLQIYALSVDGAVPCICYICINCALLHDSIDKDNLYVAVDYCYCCAVLLTLSGYRFVPQLKHVVSECSYSIGYHFLLISSHCSSPSSTPDHS